MARTVRLGAVGKNAAARPHAVIGAGIILLAATVLVCVGLIAVPLWTALGDGGLSQPIFGACNDSKDVGAGRACYEKSVSGALGVPNGGNAPIMPPALTRQND
jgi:hypothetical protein